MGSFKPPESATFKQFVILDADGVVSALSAIDGGQIDEILTRSAEEKGGEAGGELNLGPAKGRGKRGKTRKVEEEIRLARTRHAAAARLLESLHETKGVGVVDGELGEEVASQIRPGMVIEFRAKLHLHPLHQADQMLRSFVEVAPKLGQGGTSKELKETLEIWGVIAGTGASDARFLIEPRTAAEQMPRLLLPVPKDQLQVGLDDVLGDVTVVAQVEAIIAEGDSHQTIRFLRGGPAGSLERGALEEALPNLIDGLGEMGIDISNEDIIIEGPALLLRPICAYR